MAASAESQTETSAGTLETLYLVPDRLDARLTPQRHVGNVPSRGADTGKADTIDSGPILSESTLSGFQYRNYPKAASTADRPVIVSSAKGCGNLCVAHFVDPDGRRSPFRRGQGSAGCLLSDWLVILG